MMKERNNLDKRRMEHELEMERLKFHSLVASSGPNYAYPLSNDTSTMINAPGTVDSNEQSIHGNTKDAIVLNFTNNVHENVREASVIVADDNLVTKKATSMML